MEKKKIDFEGNGMKSYLFGAWVGLMVYWPGTGITDWRWWVIVIGTHFMGLWTFYDIRERLD